MSSDLNAGAARLVARVPFYYGWINLVLAAFAMLATLPGRSVGIGLITEPLLADLSLSRLSFGAMNFWATLIGASFNLLCGPAIDRFGVRIVATIVIGMLGGVVLIFSGVQAATWLLLLLILVRGVGQSALSVVSLAVIGKWFVRRLSIAMGIFAVLVSIGFVIAIVVTENAVLANGWRQTWSDLGWLLLLTSTFAYAAIRKDPEWVGILPDTNAASRKFDEGAQTNLISAFSLREALKTATFWVLALGSAFYNLVIAGVLLFNQSILAELGFNENVFRNAMAAFMFTGLIGNFIGGWLARKWSLTRLMSVALIPVILYLLAFPHIASAAQAYVHAGLMGFAGGFVTVIFFTSWGKIFGRPHLGKIQGAAQVLTVLASATGPWLLAAVFEQTGSYDGAFYAIVPALILVTIWGWFVQNPVDSVFVSDKSSRALD